MFAILTAVSRFVQPRQPPVPVDAFPLPASHTVLFEESPRHTKRHVLGSQILGLGAAIAQAMAQHLFTPAGQPQSAEVLVAVLALLGEMPSPPPPHLTLQLRPARHQPRMISVVHTTLS
ncbi:hypothetical protein ACQKWADRAFT_279195 [Trichoderma austrokoningii]